VAQSVEHPTLDLSWGLDLRVESLSPELGSMVSVEPTVKKKKERKKCEINKCDKISFHSSDCFE